MAAAIEQKLSNDAAAHEMETVTPGESPPSSMTNHDEYVHQHMNSRLFAAMTAMAFLWIGSQIPLYLFGSVLPLIYQDIGGYDRYAWMVIGYLIPNAAVCPFVGALSDMFGRRQVAVVGQLALILGVTVTSTAQSMNVAICGQVFSGIGGGLNELIALAGAAELVPIAKRGNYVSAVVFSIIPFCPSALWAQLIAKASNWRYIGILVGGWNFLGLIFVMTLYKDPPRPAECESKSERMHRIDYVGGVLSISAIILWMMGLQWGAVQYSWGSAHVLVPFILALFLLAAFFIWEMRFAKHPMAPAKLFSLEKRTIIIVLLIIFVSGGNYFVLLMMWPSQVYNVYGSNPVDVGVRTLPMGFGIIGGSFIALIMLPHIKGRIREQMIFFTFMMTAFCGSIAVATPYNINTVYPLVLFASIGVGGVIIPSSIIAQIACPIELIGTITAITLSIRNIGGAVAYTAYYNVTQHKYKTLAQTLVGIDAVIKEGIVAPTNISLVTELVTLVGESRLKELRQVIATNPHVMRKDVAYEIITDASHQAFAMAYRYAYYISIAFGVITCILSLFLKDIRKYMVPPK